MNVLNLLTDIFAVRPARVHDQANQAAERPVSGIGTSFEWKFRQAVQKVTAHLRDEGEFPGSNTFRKMPEQEIASLASSAIIPFSSEAGLDQKADSPFNSVISETQNQHLHPARPFESALFAGLTRASQEMHLPNVSPEQPIVLNMSEVLQGFSGHGMDDLESLTTDTLYTIAVARANFDMQRDPALDDAARIGNFSPVEVRTAAGGGSIHVGPPVPVTQADESLAGSNSLSMSFEQLKSLFSGKLIPAELANLERMESNVQFTKTVVSPSPETATPRLQAETLQLMLPTQATPGVETGFELLLDRIVQSAHLAKDGALTELHVHLKPEFLGRMMIRVIADESGMHIEIRAENEAVRQLMNDNLATLQHRLSERGMAFSDLSILADTGWASRKEPEQPFARRSTNVVREQEATETTGEVTCVIGMNTIDYLA
ncbi:MAG: hypothetical protein Kow0099_05660 [Candidatus Abyssubacteria bacterium]